MNCCILCDHPLEPHNASEVCTECRTIVRNLLQTRIEERWRGVEIAGTDGVIVSDQGRVAKLVPIDTAHRYPRVSLAGRKFYLHQLVAHGWHGPRPPGHLTRHLDDVPTHCTPENLAWGTHADNARDRRINRRKEHHR